jgi:hypothetical protein
MPLEGTMQLITQAVRKEGGGGGGGGGIYEKELSNPSYHKILSFVSFLTAAQQVYWE